MTEDNYSQSKRAANERQSAHKQMLDFIESKSPAPNPLTTTDAEMFDRVCRACEVLGIAPPQLQAACFGINVRKSLAFGWTAYVRY